MKFLDQLFPPKKAEVLKKLWDDPQCAPAVARKISEEMWRNPSILHGDSINQLICMLETDKFEHTPEETVTVAGVICHSFRKIHIFPYFYEHLTNLQLIDAVIGNSWIREKKRAEADKNFGGSCLVGLGFFPEAFEYRRKHQGYPSREQYREVGRQAFYRAGHEDLAHNFREWENRLSQIAN